VPREGVEVKDFGTWPTQEELQKSASLWGLPDEKALPEPSKEFRGYRASKDSYIRCYNCKKVGHKVRDCVEPKQRKGTSYVPYSRPHKPTYNPSQYWRFKEERIKSLERHLVSIEKEVSALLSEHYLILRQRDMLKEDKKEIVVNFFEGSTEPSTMEWAEGPSYFKNNAMEL